MKLIRWLSSQVRRWREKRDLRQSIRRLRALQRQGYYVTAAALAGKFGKVVIAAATVAELDEWNLTPATDIFDKTPFLATSKTHLAGLNDSTGSFKGRHDMTDTNGQVALHNAMLAGTQVTLKLYVDATHFYTVPALIKAKPIKAAVTGLVDVQFDFQGDGDVVYT